MKASFKITGQLSSANIFGQFTGTYVSINSVTVDGQSEIPDKKPKKNLNKGDKVTLDFRPVQTKFNEVRGDGLINCEKVWSVECLPSLYANNPEKGIVLVVIGL